MRRTVIAGKLRRQIAGDQVREYFARHRRELDVAVIGRVRADDREAARRLARRMKRGALAFTQVETVRRRELPRPRARRLRRRGGRGARSHPERRRLRDRVGRPDQRAPASTRRRAR